MIFKRFYDHDLAQASYLIGSSRAGEALVVDPRRDYQVYLDYARDHGLKITTVAETHIHADYLSGARELAAALGATLVVSAEGGSDWQYGGLEEFELRLLQDGERFGVGQVHIEAIHTPGHTPEHLTFAIYDDETDAIMGLLTGDFIFVGSLGRPDLLETTGMERDSMRRAAKTLYESLQKFVDRVPHDVPIWPGHGAGSACGKSLGALPCTTLSYELRNREWAELLDSGDVDGFVDHILADQPETPTYFERMKIWNRDGFALRYVQRRAPRLPRTYFQKAIADGATVVDLRGREDFAAGHVKNSIHLPMGNKLATWGGWVLPKAESLVLVTDDTTSADQASDVLLRIGQDEIVGFIPFDDLEDYREIVPLPAVDAEEAHRIWEGGDGRFIDVRSSREFEEGYIPGAHHYPIARLQEVIDDIPREKPLIVYCGSGARAAVAASVMQAKKFGDIHYFDGSMGAWKKADYPLDTP